MPRLDELSLFQRLLLALLFLSLALLALVLLSRLLGSEAEAQQGSQLYEGVELNADLLKLDKRALNEAYHDQLKHLFDIWLKGQVRSDREISEGIKLARRAYNMAAQQIAKREVEAAQPGGAR